MPGQSVFNTEEFSYAVLRTGVALLGLASPMLLAGNSLLDPQSHVLLGYLGFALLSLVFALAAPLSRNQQLLGGTFFDAAFIGAALSTHSALPLLAASPLLMIGAAWCLRPAQHIQVIALHALGLLLAWHVSAWHLAPGMQLLASLYLVGGAFYALRLGQQAAKATRPNIEDEAVAGKSGLPPELLYDPDAESELGCSNISEQSVLLLHGNATDSSKLLTQLRNWGIDLLASRDVAEVLSHAVTTADSRKTPKALLVDARGRSEHPLHLLTLLQGSPVLSRLRFIAIIDGDKRLAHELTEAGYNAVLTSPLDKTLLFNALHPRHQHAASAGISSLLDRYIQAKSPLPPQDILLAMQNQVQLTVTKRLLEKSGHNVYTTSSGEQALDAIIAHRFDVALIDNTLGDMEGTEVTRIYRLTHPRPHSTPVVLMSGHLTMELQQRCEQAGADAMLTLPVKPARLNKVLEKLVTPLTTENTSTKQQRGLAPIAPETVDELDLQTLQDLEKLGNGLDFVRDLVENFGADGNELISAMRQSVQHQDIDSFRDCAHALKGSAGSVGAVRLQQFCINLSNISLREFQVETPSLLQSLEDALQLSLDALLDYINKRAEQVSRN